MSSSSWPWHFITVSGDDKIRRRELLDLRGSYAQWSVIIVMSVLRVYQAWVTHSVASTNGIASSRPRRGPVSWWDRPLVTGWIETRRQYFVCGLWLLWLTSLSVWNSGEGMFHPSIPLYLYLCLSLSSKARKEYQLILLQITSISPKPLPTSLSPKSRCKS